MASSQAGKRLNKHRPHFHFATKNYICRPLIGKGKYNIFATLQISASRKYILLHTYSIKVLHFLHLWSIGQEHSLSDFDKIIYLLNYKPECPEDAQ